MKPKRKNSSSPRAPARKCPAINPSDRDVEEMVKQGSLLVTVSFSDGRVPMKILLPSDTLNLSIEVLAQWVSASGQDYFLMHTDNPR